MVFVSETVANGLKKSPSVKTSSTASPPAPARLALPSAPQLLTPGGGGRPVAGRTAQPPYLRENLGHGHSKCACRALAHAGVQLRANPSAILQLWISKHTRQ
jgi:hypothetical protein